MMRHSRFHAVLAAFLLCAGVGHALDFVVPESAQLRNNDIVVAVRNNEAQVVPGMIQSDSYAGVRIRAGAGREITIPYANIQHVYFRNADNASYIQGLQAYQAGQYALAASMLQRTSQQVDGFDPTQRNFFLEHCLFHLADSLRLSGRVRESLEMYDRALAANRNGAYFFQIMLGRAQAMEGMGDHLGAAGEYRQMTAPTGAMSFVTKLDLRRDAERFIFQAKVGTLRAQVNGFRDQSGQVAEMERIQNEARALQAEVQKLQGLAQQARGDGNPLLADALTRTAQVGRNDLLTAQATSLQYLAENKDPQYYAQMMQLIREPLLEAVRENNRDLLQTLLLQEADAYYGLMQQEADPQKKKELAEKARFNYLRVTLSYNPPPLDLVRAHVRTGELFEMIRDAEWRRRALIQYQQAAHQRFANVGGRFYTIAQERRQALRQEMEAEEGDEG